MFAADESAPPLFFRLPLEIRQDIYIHLFRSVIVPNRLNVTDDDPAYPLNILYVCRRTYLEAHGLVLPNVPVFCDGNDDMLHTLNSIGPARIPQLRHLILRFSPLGFRFEKEAGPSGADTSDGEDELGDTTRYFHAGALLSLFPGLQLDLLEIFNAMGGSWETGRQNTDCFGSLLEADGYRRLWMRTIPGMSGPWQDMSSASRWKAAIERQLKPNPGWRAKIRLDDDNWRSKDNSRLWLTAHDAGITLARMYGSGEEDDGYESLGEEGDEVDLCHGSEKFVDIIIDRGHGADFTVKSDDDRVLICIEQHAGVHHPLFFKEASDALRKLFRENSWKTI